MYSPKIREEHIPLLYRLAKNKKTRMTKLVDEAIRQFLTREVETTEKSFHSPE